MTCYLHSFQSAQAAAMDAVANSINLIPKYENSEDSKASEL